MSSPASEIRRPALLLTGLVLALTVLAAMALRAPAAGAATNQASIMMDDDHLLYGSDRTRDATLGRMRALGVDYVRATVLWKVVALGIQSYDQAHHRRFNPADPAAYPPANWGRYDGLVQSAARDGIGVYFDVTGPGPSYGHQRAPSSLRRDVAETWMPNASQFYKFVVAVGRRYSGSYVVGRGAKSHRLPRVSLWSIWNEPNQGGWITPQWRRVGGKLIAYSPVIYRKLYLVGRLALQLTGHGRDEILIGETSPLGVSRRTATSEIDPKTFIRELMCASPSGAPYTGADAAKRDCQVFNQFGGAFATSGWAHHPYTKFDAPTQHPANPNSITVANIQDLPDLLDQLAASTHHIAPGLPIISTEYGYETNPPDPFYGIPLARQADWDNQGDFLLYANPRVLGNTQFLLLDAAPLRHFRRGTRQYWSTYQSGLLFANGTPKPSLAAYQLPIDVTPTGSGQLDVWGQLRFLAHTPPGSVPLTAQLEFRPSGSSAFAPLGSPLSADAGRHFINVLIQSPGAGALRLHYSASGIGDRFSRVVSISG